MVRGTVLHTAQTVGEGKLSFSEICDKMGRSYGSILPKLRGMNLIYHDESTNRIWYTPRSRCSPTPEVQEVQPNQPEETEMTQPNNSIDNTIVVKTYIGHNLAADLTDEQIFKRVALIEQEVASLKSITTPSVKLASAIAKLEADALAMMTYVDNR